MKRDLDLIRNMLLVIESADPEDPHVINIETFLHLNQKPRVISHHIKLLLDSKFIEADGPIYIDDIEDFYIERITSAGYDYLDSVRDTRVWSATKKKILPAGGSVALDLVKALATDYLKSLLAGTLPS